MNDLVKDQSMKRGWSAEEALDITPRRLALDNKNFPKYTISENHELWSITPVRNNKFSITLLGITYPSLKEASKAHGINYKALHYRLKSGWTVEEAFKLVPKHKSGKSIVLDNKSYPSIKAAAKLHKKNYTKIQSRLKSGWTIEEAFDITPRQYYDNKQIGYIYLITNMTEGKKYIGLTRSTPVKRWQQHVKKAFDEDNYFSSYSLQHAIKRLGVDNFKLEILCSAKSIHELAEMEKFHIIEHKTLIPLGYNISKGGEGVDCLGKKFTVAGVTYPSFKEAARAYSLNPETVRGRLNSDWTIEEAFDIVEKENKNVLTLNGVTYKSRSQAADAYNIDVKLVEARLNINWSIEEAFGIKEKPNASHKSVIVNGVTYPSIEKATNTFKIPIVLVRSRIRKGFSIEEALGLKEREYKHPLHKELIINGKYFKSAREASLAFGIDANTFRNRLRLGFTAEEAAGITPRKRTRSSGPKQTKIKKNSIEVNGTFYKSITEAAKAHSLASYLVKARLKLGWSIEEALEIIKRDSKGKPIPIVIQGKTYPSKFEAAKAFNIGYGTLKWRLSKGWPIEKAVGLTEK